MGGRWIKGIRKPLDQSDTENRVKEMRISKNTGSSKGFYDFPKIGIGIANLLRNEKKKNCFEDMFCNGNSNFNFTGNALSKRSGYA